MQAGTLTLAEAIRATPACTLVPVAIGMALLFTLPPPGEWGISGHRRQGRADEPARCCSGTRKYRHLASQSRSRCRP